MAIPEGYRLLTAEDIGKVFGVDLEQVIYFDTSKEITNTTRTTFLTLQVEGFTSNPTISGNSSRVDITYSGDYTTIWGVGSAYDESGWQVESFDIQNITSRYNISIYSYDTPTDWIYVKDIIDPKAQFITDMYGLSDSINNKAGSSGKKTIKEMKSLVDGLKTEFVTQEKTVTPSKETQSVVPDDSYDGLSKVTVNHIPDEYIVPIGSLNITENGTHDVTDKASVVVNVPSEEPVYWDGSYTESDSNGYTLTLNCDADVINSDYFYSLDSGVTWLQFKSSTMVLNGITKIRFKTTTTTSNYIAVGTTYGNHDIQFSSPNSGIIDREIAEDTTWYVFTDIDKGGSSD